MHYFHEEKLNEWWYGLGLDALLHIMYIPEYEDANDFIDKCDEYWEGLGYEDKLEIYKSFAG